MSAKLKQFIKNKGFSESEIGRMNDSLIKDFAVEYRYAKRIGMVE